jgi:predicted phosphate transport protein (TIGR00153 family)
LFKIFARSADDLFHHLAALGVNLEEAVFRFDAMIVNWEERENLLQSVRETEHNGDRLQRELHNYLRDTFFVPGDRESVLVLANELDDVVDMTLKIASTLLLYRVEEPPAAFRDMVRLLRECATNLRLAFEIFRDRSRRKEIDDLCLRVIALEDQADEVNRQGLERLFDQPTDMLHLLKWKDLLDWADEAVDSANHVAYRLMSLNNDLH